MINHAFDDFAGSFHQSQILTPHFAFISYHVCRLEFGLFVEAVNVGKYRRIEVRASSRGEEVGYTWGFSPCFIKETGREVPQGWSVSRFLLCLSIFRSSSVCLITTLWRERIRNQNYTRWMDQALRISEPSFPRSRLSSLPFSNSCGMGLEGGVTIETEDEDMPPCMHYNSAEFVYR